AKVQDMDGYELFTMVRRDPATKDTPFLLLAGRDRPIARAATEAGVDMTVTGDFTLATVMQRIRELLGDAPPTVVPAAIPAKGPAKMPARAPAAPAPPTPPWSPRRSGLGPRQRCRRGLRLLLRRPPRRAERRSRAGAVSRGHLA